MLIDECMELKKLHISKLKKMLLIIMYICR